MRKFKTRHQFVKELFKETNGVWWYDEYHAIVDGKITKMQRYVALRVEGACIDWVAYVFKGNSMEMQFGGWVCSIVTMPSLYEVREYVKRCAHRAFS